MFSHVAESKAPPGNAPDPVLNALLPAAAVGRTTPIVMRERCLLVAPVYHTSEPTAPLMLPRRER